VAQDLEIMLENKDKQLENKLMEDKFVEQDKELVVLVLMMDVLLKLQYVQNMDIASVLHINLEVLNVDKVFLKYRFCHLLSLEIPFLTLTNLLKR